MDGRTECPHHPGYTYNTSTGDCACGSNHYRWASAWNPGGLVVPPQRRAEVTE